MPARKQKLPRILHREEVEALFAAPNLDVPTGLRDRCLMELMYRAGLRVGEVCALKPRDVDATNGIVRIFAGKGGDGTAYFDAERLGPLLRDWKRMRRVLPRSEFLFCTLKGGPVSVRSVEQMMRRRARKAGVETRVTPHMLRHSFATELYEEGFNDPEVQKLMRHKDPRTTRVYTHLAAPALRAKVQKRSQRR